MGAHDELWQLYQKETSVDVKKRIISGDVRRRQCDAADRAGQDREESRAAPHRDSQPGRDGLQAHGDALVEIYGTEKDPAIKKTVINGLFIQGNATALVAIAPQGTDIEMKKEIVSRLSTMRAKVATRLPDGDPEQVVEAAMSKFFSIIAMSLTAVVAAGAAAAQQPRITNGR